MIAALACEGIGMMEVMAANTRLGWQLWAAAAAIAIVCGAIARWRRASWRRLIPLAALVVLHPGWWMSAYGGDCGITLVEGSISMTALTAIGGAVVLRSAFRRLATTR
jgi:hypothetical protein